MPTENPSLPPNEMAPAVAPVGAVPRWRWWIHLALIGGYLAVVAVMGWARGGGAPALTGTTRGLLLVCAVEFGIFALVFCLAVLASRASRDDLMLRWRRGLLPVLLGIGYSVAIRIVTVIVAIFVIFVAVATHLATPDSIQKFAIAHRPKVESLVDSAALHNNPAYFWLTITLVSFVVAGLREELWRAGFLAGLRGSFPGKFESRIAQVAGVAIAAIVFGCGHVAQGSVAMGLTAVLGFGLGLVMVLHRSIWPAVIAHGMFDASSFILLAVFGDQLLKAFPT